MEKIKFLVQGSAAKPYEVEFSKENNRVIATCSCPAGRYSRHCKHRILILANKSKAKDIVSENLEDVKIVSSWIEGTEVEEALNYFIEMQELEKKAKKEAIKAKKYFEKIMSKWI